MSNSILDTVENGLKEVVALPGEAIAEAKKLYHDVVDPIHSIENTAKGYLNEFKQLTSGAGNPGSPNTQQPGFFGGGDESPPSQQQGGGQGTGDQSSPDAPTASSGGWWQKLKNFFTGGDATPTSDGAAGDDDSGGIFGKIFNGIKKFLSNPIGAIVELLFGMISMIMGISSGGSSLLSGIGSFLGISDDDAPGGGILDRAKTAIKKGEETFERVSHESLGQIARDIGHNIVHSGERVASGIKHDFKASGDMLSRANHAVDYLVNVEHVDKVHAIGMVASYVAESGLNPNAYGHGSEAQGKAGEAYGIAQFHPDRQANFEKWAHHSIKDSTLEEQLSFAVHEVRDGKEQAAGKKLAETTTVADAATVYCTDCIRPGDKVGQSQLRAGIAEQILASREPSQGLEVSGNSAPLPGQNGNFFKHATAQTLGG